MEKKGRKQGRKKKEEGREEKEGREGGMEEGGGQARKGRCKGGKQDRRSPEGGGVETSSCLKLYVQKLL